MVKRIPASKSKAKCQKRLNKCNKPVAQLVPTKEKPESLFGKMKGTIHIVGDILSPVEKW